MAYGEFNWLLLYAVIVIVAAALAHLFTRRLPKETRRKASFWALPAAVAFGLLLQTFFMGVDFMLTGYNWLPGVAMVVVAVLAKVFFPQ